MSAEQAIRPEWPFNGPPKRVVIKVGSNVLSTSKGTLDEARIEALAADVHRLRESASEVIIVSSGAVAAGMGIIGQGSRPRELPKLQGLAAIGQCQLMKAWSSAFSKFGTPVAQVLLTRADLEDRQRYLNIRYTLESLLALKAVPVINENDTVITEELTVGDNDVLSAITAAKTGADLLVILSDIDGLYTASPARDPKAELIPVVRGITPQIRALGEGSGSRVGRGGMASKLTAATHANRFGVTVAIANGKNAGMLANVLSGEFRGTLFLPPTRQRKKGSARAHWITAQKPKGFLKVDAGAQRALVEQNRSLLAVGITGVEGTFKVGDVVAVQSAAGVELARGIVNFSSAEVAMIRGRKNADLAAVLGTEPQYEEVVHRDNLIVG